MTTSSAPSAPSEAAGAAVRTLPDWLRRLLGVAMEREVIEEAGITVIARKTGG
ncbi:MAG TPA: hypothetical protein VGX37_08195 [Allosphingosinicella sp.]|jgi:8-oxo-dGTP pyrophosphatase MutT (NUDIX family)|nr:hypothetical protein [Allosphingosinicella sp.]